MTVRTGFAATTTVNGELVVNYTTEKTSNTTGLGKMMNSMIELLTRSKAPGVGGVVGTYNDTVIGEACHKLFNGAHAVNVYGITINSQYFERSGLLP